VDVEVGEVVGGERHGGSMVARRAVAGPAAARLHPASVFAGRDVAAAAPFRPGVA
jgi:hypothetical protein